MSFAMIMKVTIVLFSIVATITALSEEFQKNVKDRVKEIGYKCAEENGATEQDIKELKSNQIPPSSHEAMCVLFCMNKEIGIQNDDGKLNVMGAFALLETLKNEDPDFYLKMFQVAIVCGRKMTTLMSDDPCVTATNMAICSKEETIKIGIDPSLFIIED